MKLRFVGVALAAMACGWAGGAEAAQLTIKGLGSYDYQYTDNINNQQASGHVSNIPFTFTLSANDFSKVSNGSYASDSMLNSSTLEIGGTNAYAALSQGNLGPNRITGDSGSSTFYFPLDVSQSSIQSPLFGGIYGGLPLSGGDTTLYVNFTVPFNVTDPNGSYGYYSATAFGTIFYPQSGYGGLNGMDFYTNFTFNLNINSIAVNEVPIPSAVLLFGAALLTLGGCGYKRRKRVVAA